MTQRKKKLKKENYCTSVSEKVFLDNYTHR